MVYTKVFLVAMMATQRMVMGRFSFLILRRCSSTCEVEFEFRCENGTNCVEIKAPTFLITEISADFVVQIDFSEPIMDPDEGI